MSRKGKDASSTNTAVRLPGVSDRLERDTEPCPAGPELSTCARCGLPFGEEPNHCGDYTGSDPPDAKLMRRMEARVSCRDREIGNIRALLRGGTRKLERVMENLDDLLEALS